MNLARNVWICKKCLICKHLTGLSEIQDSCKILADSVWYVPLLQDSCKKCMGVRLGVHCYPGILLQLNSLLILASPIYFTVGEKLKIQQVAWIFNSKFEELKIPVFSQGGNVERCSKADYVWKSWKNRIVLKKIIGGYIYWENLISDEKWEFWTVSECRKIWKRLLGLFNIHSVAKYQKKIRGSLGAIKNIGNESLCAETNWS